MLRLRLSMLLLCVLPAVLQAADVERPSCESASATLEPFAPVTGQALSHAQADALQRLFRSLDGRWRGSVVEQVCMVSGATQTRDYTASLKLVAGSRQLQLSGEYVQDKSGAMRRFTRKLLLTDDGLRVDHPSRVGEVELGHADATGLDYAQRYRTVHKLPDDANATAASPANPLATVLSLVAGGQAESGDAVPSEDVANSNLVTGQSVPKAPPEPRRRSLAREERFSLQTNGSRQLVLIQYFYTQGAFTGSMRWRLQRR